MLSGYERWRRTEGFGVSSSSNSAGSSKTTSGPGKEEPSGSSRSSTEKSTASTEPNLEAYRKLLEPDIEDVLIDPSSGLVREIVAAFEPALDLTEEMLVSDQPIPASPPPKPQPTSREEAERRLHAVYRELFEDAVRLSITKSGDYGDMTPEKSSYFPFGDASYAHMLHTKMSRIMNLVKRAQRGETANHESLDDSLVDLFNYTLFYMAFRRTFK